MMQTETGLQIKGIKDGLLVRLTDESWEALQADWLSQIESHVDSCKGALIKKGEMLDATNVLDILTIPLLGMIPEESVVIKTNLGQPVVLEEKSRVGAGFRNSPGRLEGKGIPLLDRDSKDGFFNRVSRMMKPGGN
jgi:septum site-determining protein MinD